MAVASSQRNSRRRPASDEDASSGGEEEQAQVQLAKPERVAQHLFLQTLLARRTITSRTADKLYQKFVRMCDAEHADSFVHFKTKISQKLEDDFGFSLKEEQDPQTGEYYLVLINTISNDISKVATEYKPEEIAFFRVLVNKIVSAPNLAYSVPWSQGVKCVRDEAVKPPISQKNAEPLLRSLIAKGWISVNADKALSLAPRALVELDTYIREEYADHDDGETEHDKVYVNCTKCVRLVTVGWACDAANCPVRLHKFCAKDALIRGACPGTSREDNCGHDWEADGDGNYNGAVLIGPDRRAENDDESSDVDEPTPVPAKKRGPRQSNGGGASARKGKGKRRAEDSNEEEEEEEPEDEEEDELEDSIPTQGRSKRRIPADEDDEMSE